MYFSTIDLDSQKGRFKIAKEILKCKYIQRLEIKRSTRKGWHFSLFCSKRCLKCRARFDDRKRLYADMTNRKARNRNVLFDKKFKVRFNGGAIEILEY